MAEITVVERTKNFDVVKIEGIDKPEKINVVTGMIKETTSNSVTLILQDKDAVSINGDVYLLWNRAKKVFVRQ
jgi:hypothetical protein